ncbi:unnamed protein product [Rotaria sp. Silwood2]|nr:unnamed protein product [Rotaria sp. Silwood2]CAF2552742.1 unnamed protein product [Rotaria sp. Silwood2]CAF2773946.1 unnamed protein product [Rotaria sp. Silwood2]CAF2960558.1 unnamed protein product [Rotaria sp. Silwood2]
MRQLREAQDSRNVTTSASTNRSSYQYSITAATTTSSSESVHDATLQSTTAAIELENSLNYPISSNPCVICLTKEKRLACMPCGHLVACVPCGHSLRSCPICRCEIDAFVRIYIYA